MYKLAFTRFAVLFSFFVHAISIRLSFKNIYLNFAPLSKINYPLLCRGFALRSVRGAQTHVHVSEYLFAFTLSRVEDSLQPGSEILCYSSKAKNVFLRGGGIKLF
jgi:hypothetical protein